MLPNILLVFSDQHRWCDLGCYGNAQVSSPNLDAFGERATRFTHCIANAPLCVPARASLLTGLHALKHRAITNDLPVRQDVTSLAHVLGEAGYRTGYVGKWHLAGVPRDAPVPRGPARLGFEEWKVCECNHDYMHAYYYDEEDRRVDITGYEPVAQTDLAIDFAKRHRGHPWFLCLSWGPPHDPYHLVPARYAGLYPRRELRLRPNVPERIHDTQTRILSGEQIRTNYQGYYAHITALDEQFGRLLAALDATGQREQTIVIYTSDHGDMLGSQGWTNKQLPYDEAIRVPLLVAWGKYTPGHVTDELIGLVDLPTSILGLVGLRFPDAVDGVDLHRLIIDPEAQGLGACYVYDLVPCHQAMARGGSEWRAIRTKQHTLARTASDTGFALYDNLADPYQMHNLINDPQAASVRAELLAQLDALISRYDELLLWQEMIRKYGLRQEWNKSQAYFGLSPLD